MRKKSKKEKETTEVVPSGPAQIHSKFWLTWDFGRGLYQNSAPDISHDIFASIEKDRIESEEAIRESEKLLAFNPPFHYIQTKNASQGSHWDHR